jgi:tRNA(His) guanylyltransferase
MSRLSEQDEFGARMKAYEAVETGRRFDVALPVYARIDGRSFSRFTRGMDRPFDERMTSAMIETTRYLVGQTHARIGYTQSDEISLVWQAETETSDIFFAGKVQKIVSVLASMAAAKLATVTPEGFRDRLPHFDARVFQLPSRSEAANAILWRAMDARKNSISMVAQSRFSHTALFGKDQKAMLAMLKEVGVDFEEDYPERFKRGTFLRRLTALRGLTEEELSRIPVERRPVGPVARSSVVEFGVPPFNKVINREAFIFEGAEPEV